MRVARPYGSEPADTDKGLNGQDLLAFLRQMLAELQRYSMRSDGTPVMSVCGWDS